MRSENLVRTAKVGAAVGVLVLALVVTAFVAGRALLRAHSDDAAAQDTVAIDIHTPSDTGVQVASLDDGLADVGDQPSSEGTADDKTDDEELTAGPQEVPEAAGEASQEAAEQPVRDPERTADETADPVDPSDRPDANTGDTTQSVTPPVSESPTASLETSITLSEKEAKKAEKDAEKDARDAARDAWKDARQLDVPDTLGMPTYLWPRYWILWPPDSAPGKSDYR